MRSLSLIAVLCLGSLLAGCGGDDPTIPADAPDGHTVSQHGVPHMPGLHDPLDNCAACHGALLRGGDSGEPSCYSCHGKKW